jgi:hypothetical protein
LTSAHISNGVRPAVLSTQNPLLKITTTLLLLSLVYEMLVFILLLVCGLAITPSLATFNYLGGYDTDAIASTYTITSECVAALYRTPVRPLNAMTDCHHRNADVDCDDTLALLGGGPDNTCAFFISINTRH